VPAIPAEGDTKRPAAQPDLDVFVAELSTDQRQALLGMLGRSQAG